MKTLRRLVFSVLIVLSIWNIYLFIVSPSGMSILTGVLVSAFGWVIPTAIIVSTIVSMSKSIAPVMMTLFFNIFIFWLISGYIHSQDPSKVFLLALSALMYWFMCFLILLMRLFWPSFTRWIKFNYTFDPPPK